MQKTIISHDIHGAEYTVPIEKLKWRPAAYGIIIQDHKILLTKQGGAFHLPGGGINLGEAPEDGVIREIREETGVEVGNPRRVGPIISGFFTMNHSTDAELTHVHSLLMYYQCDLVGGALSIDGFEEDEKLIGEMPEWIVLEQLDEIKAGSSIDWRSIVKNLLN